ncbi:MAG: zinc-dependent metalloprotease [Deltaproteobacteria bacterium]|nr:zinc-dependent metalloprotease [Deltaproteobacteria bacterium]
MRRFGMGLVASALVTLALAGCQSQRDPINRVQTNLVEKTIFEGEWWYSRTTVDLNYEDTLVGQSAGIFTLSPFVGDMAADAGIAGYSLVRIRWVIDENVLYAYRSYELVGGGNDDYAPNAGYRGQPVAAFAISSHADIRRDYNPITGEETNVLVENTTDRRWYERQYMRVDWTKNLIVGSYMTNNSTEYSELFGALSREASPLYCGEGSTCPANWQPQFVRLGDDAQYRFRNEWPAGAESTIHYMSFVNQEIWSPGINPLLIGGGGIPAATQVTIRSSFLRIPPNHDYDAELEMHSEFDRFGIIRMSQRTYTRGGRDAPGGGLTPDLGETDFLNFFRSRHDFWDNNLREEAVCVNNGDCMDVPGSTCDPANRRCTEPLANRTPRRVTYTLNAGHPRYLNRAAFDTVAQWNAIVMAGARAALGQPVPEYAPRQCQRDDPFDYCYCDGLPAGESTCAGLYNPFVEPDAQEVVNGADPFRCHVSGPADVASPSAYDDYTAEHNTYAFVGEECRLVLEVNRCDREPGAACQELGDLRYHFFHYIDHTGISFGGVSLPLSDPLTGELIVSNANMSGESIHSIAGIGRYFRMLRGEISEEHFYESEEVRGYFANIGNVDRPVTVGVTTGGGDPAGPDGVVERPDDATDPAALLMARAQSNMERVRPRVEALQGVEGRAAIYQDRLRMLAGTSFERRFADGVQNEMPNGVGMANLPTADSLSRDAALDQLSPFRGNMLENLQLDTRRARYMSERHMCLTGIEGRIFNNEDSLYFANLAQGRSDAEVDMRYRQSVFRQVMLHEMGHSLGLEHNMAGSLDRDNYSATWFRLNDANPLPNFADYDADANGGVVGEEASNWQRDYRAAREQRSLTGIQAHEGAAIMDYQGGTGNFYNIGTWDAAAVTFNYFNLTEAWNGDPRERQASGDVLVRPDPIDPDGGSRRSLDRISWRFYRGGETCTTSADCPFSAGSGALVEGQLVAQTCVTHSRYDRLSGACDPAMGLPCICSNFDRDFDNFVQVGGCRTADNSCVPVSSGSCLDDNEDSVPDISCGWTSASGVGRAPAFPIRYLYCDNSRINDISWCNWFDAGSSFREAVDNWRQMFTRRWPSWYRRNFREGYRGASMFTYYQLAAKFFQHLFWRYFNEPEFASAQGPLGFLDQYFASIDSMNWFAEMASLPEPGAYRFDRDNNIYVPARAGDPTDITLGVGQGYPLWSQWQNTLNGWYRMERSGVFWDKINALYALAIRDWGLSFGTDERYYINYYDLFDVEMSDLFGGLIVDDPREYSPRIVEEGGQVRVQYMDYFRDTCPNGGVNLPCRMTPLSDAYPAPAIRSGSSEVIRDFAAVMSLAQFPVFYDTTYEQKLFVFVEGNGDGFRIPETRPDGTPSCGFGEADCTTPDYIRYTSERFGQTYVAVAIAPRLQYNLPEENLGFRLLEKANRLQGQLASASGARREELRRELDRLETFLEYLIELQRSYGVSSYF